MNSLNIETKNEKPVAKIQGADAQNPQTHTIVKYRGKLHSWENQWLKSLEEGTDIEVVDDNGEEFIFLGSSQEDREVTLDDVL